MWPDSQRTFRQTRSFGLAAKPKTVPDHLLIGNALVVDLPSPGSIRSAATQEYQWPTLCSWQRTARFGDKSQRRNATAERFASWWWGSAPDPTRRAYSAFQNRQLHLKGLISKRKEREKGKGKREGERTERKGKGKRRGNGREREGEEEKGRRGKGEGIQVVGKVAPGAEGSWTLHAPDDKYM